MENLVLKWMPDFGKLYERIKLNNLFVDVNVSKYGFFSPKEILMLTQFFVVQNDNNIDGSLICDPKNAWYFEVIKLVDFCNTNFKAPVHQKQSISTAIPIKRIDVNTMNSYILQAINFFSRFCIGKDIEILSICISEIINNVNDHSQSLYDSYIFSQYYKRQGVIKFAISDLGVGIPKTVNNYLLSIGIPQLTNVNALEWAIQEGKTAKSKAHNMGFGLFNIMLYLKDIGTLEIFSDNVHCYLNNFGKLTFGKNPIDHFKGTLIAVNINIGSLEEKDETILVDFPF